MIYSVRMFYESGPGEEKTTEHEEEIKYKYFKYTS